MELVTDGSYVIEIVEIKDDEDSLSDVASFDLALFKLFLEIADYGMVHDHQSVDAEASLLL